MRSLQEVLVEVVRLQIAEQQAAVALAGERDLLQSWNEGMERAKHMRDFHGRYWDMEYALGCQKEYEARVEKARRSFEEIQKKLTDLADELAKQAL